MATVPRHRRLPAAACAAILILLPAHRALGGGAARLEATAAIPFSPRSHPLAAAAGFSALPLAGVAAVVPAAAIAAEAPLPAPAFSERADAVSGLSELRAAAALPSGADGPGLVFDGGSPEGKPSAAEAVPDAPPADAAELKSRLRALQLVPTSSAELRAGLIRHLRIVQESLRSGTWPQLRAESEGKLSLLIGMLEYLKKALAKDVSLCKKCVSNRSCSKVEGGKGCSGCLASVKMSAEEVDRALRTAGDVSAHLKSPTIEGVHGYLSELSRDALVSSADREKWDSRYASGDYTPGTAPAPFLAEVAHLLPREGRALDLAMGAGRNGVFLAERGLDVLGLDISEEGLKRARALAAEKVVSIRAEAADLDVRDLERAAYDVILSIRYLNRRLLAQVKDALKPGGWVLIEAFAPDARRPGSKPEHFIGKDELSRVFDGFEIVRSEVRDAGGRAVVVFLARKRAR